MNKNKCSACGQRIAAEIHRINENYDAQRSRTKRRRRLTQVHAEVALCTASATSRAQAWVGTTDIRPRRSAACTFLTRPRRRSLRTCTWVSLRTSFGGATSEPCGS